MKKTIQLTESEFRNIVAKSVQNIMNESRGNGHGMSDEEKRKARDEHNDMRKHQHHTGRGVKKTPGDKKAYDIIKHEGDRGNPYSKTLKKGGAADWVANMQDDEVNENKGFMKQTLRLTESELNRIIREALNEIGIQSADGKIYSLHGNSETKRDYYWCIHQCEGQRTNPMDWECVKCIEDSATSDDATQSSFATPQEAYNDGLKQLQYYSDGLYMLQVYYFTPNGAGDYVSGYMAYNVYGEITEYYATLFTIS